MTNRIILMLGLFLMTVNVSHGKTDSSSLIKPNDKTLNQSDQADSATVFVSFIVETTGKITHVEVSKIKCKKCSKEFKENLKSEAIRIIKSMPDLETRKERIKYFQPIKFKLTDESPKYKHQLLKSTTTPNN